MHLIIRYFNSDSIDVQTDLRGVEPRFEPSTKADTLRVFHSRVLDVRLQSPPDPLMRVKPLLIYFNELKITERPVVVVVRVVKIIR